MRVREEGWDEFEGGYFWRDVREETFSLASSNFQTLAL